MEDESKDLELVNKFIEEYNQRIDWNLELREKMKLTPEVMANGKVDYLISHFIATEKIISENYDIDTASVYFYEDTGINELQVYNYGCYCASYFWCKFGMTKEEYFKDRIEYMTKEINKLYSEAKTEMEKLQGDMFCLNELSNGLFQTIQ